MRISPQELLGFLRQHSVAVMATVTAHGIPEAAAIEFGVGDNLEIVFATYATYRKYANLKANAAVALVIGWDQATVQYEGQAEELFDGELEVVKRLYFQQVPNARKFDTDPRTRWFRVRPSLIRYRDYRVDSEYIDELRMTGRSCG